MVDRGALAGIPALAGATREALTALSRHAYAVSFRPEQRVISRYNPARRLIFMGKGLAALEGVSVGGKQRIACLYRPGDVIGSRFLIDTSDSGHEVVALTDVEGIAIKVGDLERIGLVYPQILFGLTRSFVRRLDSLMNRLLCCTTDEVPVRLGGVLLDLSNEGHGAWRPLDHRLPHRVLAEIVGASRPHVSAILGELEESGAVRRGGRANSLQVCPDQLREMIHQGAERGVA